MTAQLVFVARNYSVVNSEHVKDQGCVMTSLHEASCLWTNCRSVKFFPEKWEIKINFLVGAVKREA